jgi:hypothetical protein
MNKLSILAFSIFPLTNLGKLEITDDRFEFIAPENIKNPETMHDYLNKKRIDILILNIYMDHHPGSIQAGLNFVKSARHNGFKGLIIGTSNHHESEHTINKAILSGFDLYISDEDLHESLPDILVSYADIQQEPGELPFVVDRKLYDAKIKDAGKHLFYGYAKTFFKHHRHEQWAVISQDKLVVDYNKNDPAPSDSTLYELMNKNQKYLFLFYKTEFVNEKEKKAA